jgi:hypothetical protein
LRPPAILQIQRSAAWRNDLDVTGKRKPANLLADLAGAAKKEDAHPSRALHGEAAAAGGVVR